MEQGEDQTIPFNRPYLVGTETGYIVEAVEQGWLAAHGGFARRCEAWLEGNTGCARALLTHSCTAALEAAALLLDIGAGDEVIVPSFTFVTTASAFAARGATPVFVDVEPETLNLDPERVAAAVGPRTRAIVPIHYGGVAADLDSLDAIAADCGATVVEDAAQGLMASLGDRPLGSAGALGAISFHETKNVTCGEGGALLVNDPRLVERAEIAWDKGTDRRRFERGEVDKYTWVEIGSSFGAGEVSAAFLFAQLERAAEITSSRLRIWARYDEAFAGLEQQGSLRRPRVPPGRMHNAHLYYLLLPAAGARPAFLQRLAERGVMAVFHYVPLHGSPAGLRFGRQGGPMSVTNDVSSRLVRLPLWAGMSSEQVERVIDAVAEAIS